MFLKLFNPFKQHNLTSTEITKPLMQKIYKSLIVLYTSPITTNQNITIDRYAGTVKSVNLWYVTLVSKQKRIYIPTSFIYDKIIEVSKN